MSFPAATWATWREQQPAAAARDGRTADACTRAGSQAAQAAEIVKELLRDGYNPIVLLPLHPTVDYVTEALPQPRAAHCGRSDRHAPAQRRGIGLLSRAVSEPSSVCTDCLSEGCINLRRAFDASYITTSPGTRPAMSSAKAGSDATGPSKRIKVVTYYGIDNQSTGSCRRAAAQTQDDPRFARHFVRCRAMPPRSSRRFSKGCCSRGIGLFRPFHPGFEAYHEAAAVGAQPAWENAADARSARARCSPTDDQGR